VERFFLIAAKTTFRNYHSLTIPDNNHLNSENPISKENQWIFILQTINVLTLLPGD